MVCVNLMYVKKQDATWRPTDAVNVKQKVRADEPKAVEDKRE